MVAKGLLMVPLLLGFAWFTTMVFSAKQQVTNAQLAPDRLNILVTGLFIFILVYSTFLFFTFRWINRATQIQMHTAAKKGRVYKHV